MCIYVYSCRCGVKKLGDKEKKYVHMLNATLCATGRAICCLLETYQDVDGVHIPEVLIPYMGGITFLPFIRAARASDTVASVPKPLADSTVPSPSPAASAVTSTKSTPPPVVATSTTTPTTAKPPAPPAVTTTTPPIASTLPPAAQAIVDKIAAKGDEIRVLKAAKVSNSMYINIIKCRIYSISVEDFSSYELIWYNIYYCLLYGCYNVTLNRVLLADISMIDLS